MKKVNVKLISLVMVVASGFTTHARVSDFNSMINENTQAQKELQKNVSQNIQELRIAQQKNVKTEVASTISSEEPTYISPTKKGFLKFKKEVSNYRPSEKKQYERLAEELGETY